MFVSWIILDYFKIWFSFSGLAADAGNTISISGEGEVLVSASECGTVQYLCAKVSGVHSSVTDTEGNKNCMCHSITTLLECTAGK